MAYIVILLSGEDNLLPKRSMPMYAIYPYVSIKSIRQVIMAHAGLCVELRSIIQSCPTRPTIWALRRVRYSLRTVGLRLFRRIPSQSLWLVCAQWMSQVALKAYVGDACCGTWYQMCQITSPTQTPWNIIAFYLGKTDVSCDPPRSVQPWLDRRDLVGSRWHLQQVVDLVASCF